MKNFGRMKKCITFAVQNLTRAGNALYYGGLFLYPNIFDNKELAFVLCGSGNARDIFSREILQQVTDAFIFINKNIIMQKKREFMDSHTLCGSRFNGKAEEAEV